MIKMGQWYYSIDNRGEQKMINISKNNKLRWRKQQINLQNLLNHQINSVFKVEQNGKITKEDKPDLFYFPHDTDENLENINEKPKQLDLGSEDEDNKDNRNLFDRNTSQKLTQSQIMEMKDNEEGDEIVKKLINNSETFKLKTQYSQVKYMKKKIDKFLFYFTIQETSLDRIQKHWFQESPAKINFMRIDALSLFLQLSALTNGSNILMFDNTFALTLAGVTQRLNNTGNISVVFAQVNKSSFHDMLPFTQMNFPPETLSHVKHIKVDDLNPDLNEKFTHLLIAGEFNFKEIIQNCSTYIESGSNITIYSSFLEPLIETSEYMIESQIYTQPIILDCFLREQQVLENRTHPNVEMNAFSGYLLTSFKLN